MTWTTLGPSGATAPIGIALMVVSGLALVYALCLMVRVVRLTRIEREEDDEEEEAP